METVRGSGGEAAEIPPPPPPLELAVRRGDQRPQCKARRCQYLRHSRPLDDLRSCGFCCGLCYEIFEGITTTSPEGPFHGPRCEREVAGPPPPPPPPRLELRLGNGDKPARCKRKGCPYLRHSDPLKSRHFSGYCCGCCFDMEEGGVVAVLPNGRFHGDKCEGVLVRDHRPGQCQSPGCTYLKHKNPEKIEEFGDYCCLICKDSDGQQHGVFCHEEPAPPPMLPMQRLRLGSVKVPPPALRDLARARPVEASSEAHPAANAVDGSQGTHWSPSSSASCHWLSVDLGEVRSLARVSVRWEASYPTSYFVEGRDANGTWKHLTSEIGDEGWVVSPLLGKCYQWLRIFANDPRLSIREFRVYPLVTGMDWLSKIEVQARGSILEFLETPTDVPVLANANSYMLGLVRTSAIPQPRMEGAPAKEEPLPEYKVAAKDLGVEPEYLRQSKLCSTLQETEKELRMNNKRRAELADPAQWERVLEQAVRKAFWFYEPGSKWKDFKVTVRRSGLPAGGAPAEDLMECSVYSTVRQFLFEGAWTLPVEFLTYALERICQREHEHSAVRLVLEDLCRCAQLAAPPLEKQLSLCTLLLERAMVGVPPPPTTRFRREVMETPEGASRKFCECMEHYMDEHKEKAFVSAFVAPARYYLQLVAPAHDIQHHGQNLWLFFALLDSALGVRMPRFAAFPHDTTGPLTGVVDFWFGLSEEAKQLFTQEEHFGKEELPEHLQAQRHIKAWSMRSLFSANKEPAEQASHPHLRPSFAMRRRCFYYDLSKGLTGSDPKYESQRKRLKSYLDRFAYFFRPDFFARQALTTLGREARPEHRGFRMALETLYKTYRSEELGYKEASSVWEHLYPQGLDKELDVARAQTLLAWCEVLRPASYALVTSKHTASCSLGAELAQTLRKHIAPVRLIQQWWRRIRHPGVFALWGSSDGSSSSSWSGRSAPARVDTRHCLLPGTRVLIGSDVRELTDLRHRDVLSDTAVIKRVDVLPCSKCTIYEIRYEAVRPSARQRGVEYSLEVTRAHHLCVRRLGKGSFRAWPAHDLKLGDFLRNDRGDEFRVTRAVPRNYSGECIELLFQDQQSTMCVGAAETPPEAFVEVYGEMDEDDKRVKKLTFRRSDCFKELFVDSPGDMLRLCSKRLEYAGFSSELCELDFPGPAKMFVDPHQAPMVVKYLRDELKQGRMAKSQFNQRVVFVNRQWFPVVVARVKAHIRQQRRQQKSRKKAGGRRNNWVHSWTDIYLDDRVDRRQKLPEEWCTGVTAEMWSKGSVRNTFIHLLPNDEDTNTSSGYLHWAKSDSHAKGAAHVGNFNYFETTRHRARNQELLEFERSSEKDLSEI